MMIDVPEYVIRPVGRSDWVSIPAAELAVVAAQLERFAGEPMEVTPYG